MLRLSDQVARICKMIQPRTQTHTRTHTEPKKDRTHMFSDNTRTVVLDMIYALV